MTTTQKHNEPLNYERKGMFDNETTTTTTTTKH